MRIVGDDTYLHVNARSEPTRMRGSGSNVGIGLIAMKTIVAGLVLAGMALGAFGPAAIAEDDAYVNDFSSDIRYVWQHAEERDGD